VRIRRFDAQHQLGYGSRVRVMTGDDVLPPQIWAGADSGDVLASLGIDSFIVERFNAKRLPKFIHKPPYVHRVARRAMEVGYLEAMRARRGQPGPIANDFCDLEKLAKNAAAALDDLIKHLEPHAATARDLALPILTAQAGIQEGLPQGLHLQAEEDASILWDARDIARRLKEAAQRKDARIRKGRQNPGKPNHAAFVRTLAEAWVYLTGCKPGSTPDHSKNPFLRFSAIAWFDVFGPKDPPEFTGALRQLPDWGAFQLSQLKSKGPSWL
jgi:hypothetical protein